METADKIKKAVGAYSVFLAAMNDKILAGRFTQNGKGLMDNGNKATKHSIADVLVYMAAAYEKTLTFEEVEMGLLVASQNGKSEDNGAMNRKSGPDLDNLGKEYEERLSSLLDEASIGMEISNLIDRFELHKGATVGYRTVEQAVGVGLRNLGWQRRRQMTDGIRAYRWYPPKDWSFGSEEPVPTEPLPEHKAINIEYDDIFDNVENFTSDEPEVSTAPRARKGSGVKPDEAMVERIRNGIVNDGITSFGLAVKFYDWDANDIDVPESESDMPHKVKLSIGATMKSLGWKKKTKRIDGIPTSGWHSPDDWEFNEPIEPIEGVVRRPAKAAEPVEPVEPVVEAKVADGLPRLNQQEPEDDIPWSYEDDGQKEEEDGDTLIEVFAEEDEAEEDIGTEEKVYVKIISGDGTEDVVERTIVMKNAGVYLVANDGEPEHRMLEWDPEEQIWFTNSINTEE